MAPNGTRSDVGPTPLGTGALDDRDNFEKTVRNNRRHPHTLHRHPRSCRPRGRAQKQRGWLRLPSHIRPPRPEPARAPSWGPPPRRRASSAPGTAICLPMSWLGFFMCGCRLTPSEPCRAGVALAFDALPRAMRLLGPSAYTDSSPVIRVNKRE